MNGVGKKRIKNDGSLGETVKVIIHALLIALIIRTFLFQPFNIPSGSMKDTLLIGDYIFVSKYSYGYSKYSFPFGLGGFSGRIFASKPERGDVAVFRLPTDTSIDYIKRVIGLPGDRIQIKEGLIYINGKAIQRVQVDDFVDIKTGQSIPRFRETLPNGMSYLTLDLTPNSLADNTQEYHVPEGHYFMMGDNRDNSTDSRFLNKVGYVPFENYVGRAEVIFFSIANGASAWQLWKWPSDIRWGRLLKVL